MGANVSRRSVHTKPRIRGRFMSLERHRDDARPCVALMYETRIFLIYNLYGILDDQTQEPNAKEHEDRMRVYPSIPLHCWRCNVPQSICRFFMALEQN